MSGAKKLLLGAAIGAALFIGYATFIKTETPGERFRKAMSAREKNCATQKIQAGDTTCDILKLQRPDPMATPEGRYAHSINVPGKPLQNVYRRGMTSKEYFDALCQTQAGEFVFKTVEGVDGILQMRPRQVATDDMLMHLYALEDPFGAVTEGDSESSKAFLVRPSRYKYIERIYRGQNDTEIVTRIIGADPDGRSNSYEQLKEQTSSTRLARYGFTWRELDLPSGREHGILGSELIVFDVANQEVLALRRGFIRSGDVTNSFTSIWWLGGHICPIPLGRASYYTYEFLTKVLEPSNESLEEYHVK